MGGSDKGVEFDELAEMIAKDTVRHIILIGQMASKIEAALRAQNFTAISPGGQTMTAIVAAARQAAQPNNVVLLSTACASFDMFKDYKDRGDQFKQAVQALS